jgi:hypothetical protein
MENCLFSVQFSPRAGASLHEGVVSGKTLSKPYVAAVRWHALLDDLPHLIGGSLCDGST